MKQLSRRAAAAMIASVPALFALPSARAQGDYPSRPVKIIVAYPAGQSTDIQARYLADRLSRAMGQQFIVENRAGASGNVGTAAAARAAPDGYTLLMGASGTHAMNPALFENPGFDADKDFDPIALTVLIPMMISAGAGSGISNLQDLVREAKARPNKVDVAIPSVTAQLVLELLKQKGVPLFGVKYKGSADSMTALLGNQVPVLIDTVAATRGQLSRIKGVAVTTPNPVAALPELKSVAQQGIPEFSVAAWNALMAPAGTPVEIRNRLHAEVRKVMDSPETLAKLTELGFERAPAMSPEEVAAFARKERREYAQIIKTAGMTVN